MALDTCGHCETVIFHNQPIVLRDGHSYHVNCHKCFICESGNLESANNVFGVLICTNCSQRIFTKQSVDRINQIENFKELFNKMKLALKSLDKTVLEDNKHLGESNIYSNKSRNSNTADEEGYNKNPIDIGFSTELKTTALRTRSFPGSSKNPVDVSYNSSFIKQGSEHDHCWKSITEKESSESLLDKNSTLVNYMKLPFMYFKNSIIDKSEKVATPHYKEYKNFYSSLKTMFNDELVRHQGRGVKRLYLTINNHKKPYKLGWLKSQHAPVNIRYSRARVGKKPSKIRCKHFKNSHSYRCMRSKVLKSAGPTKSELRTIRNKITKYTVPGMFKYLMQCGNKYTTLYTQN